MTIEPFDSDAQSFKYGTESIDVLKSVYSETNFANKTSLRAYLRDIDYIKNYFRKNESKRTGLIIKDAPVITSLMLFEAYQYLNKSFLNYCAHYSLFMQGYIGWSEVTNYYSSFFAINGLLRIQGKALTHILPHKVLYVFPYDIEKHTYIIETAIIKKSVSEERYGNFSENHADIWREYYNQFKHFDYNIRRYKTIYTVNEDNEITLEVEKRNNSNYDVLYSFDELNDMPRAKTRIEEYKARRIIQNLKPLETDPDYFQYARSGSRLCLLYELLQIVSANEEFSKYNMDTRTAFNEFLIGKLDEDPQFKDDLSSVLS